LHGDLPEMVRSALGDLQRGRRAGLETMTDPRPRGLDCNSIDCPACLAGAAKCRGFRLGRTDYRDLEHVGAQLRPTIGSCSTTYQRQPRCLHSCAFERTHRVQQTKCHALDY
jgi:hypothetical protein